jgi:hypothetical protein
MQTLSDPGRLAPAYLLDPAAKFLLAGRPVRSVSAGRAGVS